MGRPTRGEERGRTLSPSFFDRETEVVARELLGAIVECRSAAGITSGRIVEAEAYLGEHDRACHAAAGRTARTGPLYGAPGTSYVYFIYGMHWCFNAVTRREGLPSAVLVRALEPLGGVPLMRLRRPRALRDTELANGPGKLCQALGISREHNGRSLQSGAVVIRRGRPVPDCDVVVSPRVGISHAADWPLRWYVRGSPYVSRLPDRR
ncbi:MAG: DNA-3-methyladenine glycosylase [Gemmatimonadaceae bacterium]